MTSILFILIQTGYLKKFIINYVAIVIRYNNYSFDNSQQKLIKQPYSASKKPTCGTEILPELRINITKDIPTWDEVNNAPWAKDVDEGFWSPPDCSKNVTIAIIIPYRERESHLKKLLSHLHPFLQKQKAAYQIFVIEQSSKGIYNKGAVSNSGFNIANSLIYRNFSCFIFHDVDMLPIKYRNIYQCFNHPLHLGAAVDKFQYKLVYDTIVGGVLALSKEQYIKVNGYSNIFEGWGGEDDDMAERIKEEKYKVIRYPLEIGQYDMIKHNSDKGNPLNDKRVKLLTDSRIRYKMDGINNVQYKVVQRGNVKTKLVYWATIELPRLT